MRFVAAIFLFVSIPVMAEQPTFQERMCDDPSAISSLNMLASQAYIMRAQGQSKSEVDEMLSSVAEDINGRQTQFSPALRSDPESVRTYFQNIADKVYEPYLDQSDVYTIGNFLYEDCGLDAPG